MQAVLKVSVI